VHPNPARRGVVQELGGSNGRDQEQVGRYAAPAAAGAPVYLCVAVHQQGE
jgi:hypothetical protein